MGFQGLREMILEMLADNKVHTRHELSAIIYENSNMNHYDTHLKTSSVIKSLIKKGDMIRLKKGIYQANIIELTDEEIFKENRKTNASKHCSDLPKAIRTLWHLEQNLKGENLIFSDWVSIICDLNTDFDCTTLQMANDVCSTFYNIQNQFGDSIAQTLYNEKTVVLANELTAAALYLSVGGKSSDLLELANHGFFEINDMTYDMAKDLAQTVNSHESVSDAITEVRNTSTQQKSTQNQEQANAEIEEAEGLEETQTGLTYGGISQ